MQVITFRRAATAFAALAKSVSSLSELRMLTFDFGQQIVTIVY